MGDGRIVTEDTPDVTDSEESLEDLIARQEAGMNEAYAAWQESEPVNVEEGPDIDYLEPGDPVFDAETARLTAAQEETTAAYNAKWHPDEGNTPPRTLAESCAYHDARRARYDDFAAETGHRPNGAERDLIDARHRIDYQAEVQYERLPPGFYPIDMLRHLPGIEMLMENPPIVRGAYHYLVGKPRSFKSLMAVHVAGTLASQGRRVMYHLAEGQRGTPARVDAWMAHHGPWPKNVRFSYGEFELPRDIDWIADNASPFDLLIIDTLNRATPGLDENSALDMGQFTKAITHLQERSGAAVLVVHHPGHEGKRIRGSSAMQGAADVVLSMERSGTDDNPGDMVCLRVPKMKDGEEPGPRIWKMVRAAHSVTLEPLEETAIIPAPPTHEDRIRDKFGAEAFTAQQAAKVWGDEDIQATRRRLTASPWIEDAGHTEGSPPGERGRPPMRLFRLR